eukprot:s454_g5.t1
MWPPVTTNTIDGVLQFYSVGAPVWEAFIAAVGDPGQDLRLLASMPASMFGETIGACRLAGGRRITAMEAIQVGLVYRAAHLLVHMSMGGSMATWTDPDPWGSTSQQSTSTREGSPTSSGATGLQEGRMKLSQVADQADESEFVVMSESAKAQYYTKYVAKVGGLPADSEDPTVFVPFAKRHLKSQKYQSFVMQEDGSFLARMVPGPACFAHWQASYRVLRTTLIMTDVISLAHLMEWETMVERLARQYPDCWGLIAAAEDRARGEFMAKTLAKIRLEIEQGGTPPLGWNGESPWDTVWGRVLRDRDFWAEQVHMPAISWASKGQKGKPLTPEEQLAEAALPGGRQSLQPEWETQEPNVQGKRRNQARREARKRKWRSDKEELQSYRKGSRNGEGKGSGKQGSKNGSKEEACFAWNNGNGLCSGLAPGEKCRGKVARAHVCTACGSPGHPSKDCPGKKK